MSKQKKSRSEGISDHITYKSENHRRELYLKYGEKVLNGEDIRSLYDEVAKEFKLPDDKKIEIARGFLFQVREFIAESVVENNNEIVKIHTLIYEDVYRRFRNIGHEEGQLKTMKQKEKLLGLLDEEVKEFVINNQVNIISEEESQYDYSKLTDEEVERMNYLLNKVQK